MKRSLKLTLCCLGLAVISLCIGFLLQSNDGSLFSKKPKYVFYFIGDGMGINHILGTEFYNTAKVGASETQRLNFSQFNVRTFVTNYSTSHPVTDSAAAGTALATGVKTANSHIGVDANGKSLRSIADVASELGYKVGLVTNVGINHATPSCFYGHTADRFGFSKLIDEYIAGDVAFIAGSTIMDLKFGTLNTDNKHQTTAQLAERIRNAGITLTADVEVAANTTGKRVALVANHEKNKNMLHAIDFKEDEQHTLPNFSKAAIDYLSREAKSGFFLMIEGGNLDYAAHAQDAATTFQEVNELADCVELALAFAEKHPDETLIIVTSDHNTGGMSFGSSECEVQMSNLLEQKHSARYVTEKILEMRAAGKRDWKDYKQVFSDHFGLWSRVAITKEEEALLKHDLNDIFLKYGPVIHGLYDKREYVIDDATRILNKHAYIYWTGPNHTGEYTPLYVKGVGERNFLDCRDQTDIPKVMARLMGGEL